MREIPELVEGYRRFLRQRTAAQAALYRSLANHGQRPRTMVIACCDSRTDPATVFDAGPGELFVVRNVANLVPPFESEGAYHGTSAALELGVTVLGVEDLLVMGHARCGGIQAFLAGARHGASPGGFIGPWLSLLEAARMDLPQGAQMTPKAQEQALERASIRRSLDNLLSFPFVAERVASGALRLHGALFDIASGELLSLDRDGGRFVRVA